MKNSNKCELAGNPQDLSAFLSWLKLISVEVSPYLFCSHAQTEFMSTELETFADKLDRADQYVLAKLVKSCFMRFLLPQHTSV